MMERWRQVGCELNVPSNPVQPVHQSVIGLSALFPDTTQDGSMLGVYVVEGISRKLDGFTATALFPLRKRSMDLEESGTMQ